MAVALTSRTVVDIENIRAWLFQPGSGLRAHHRFRQLWAAIGNLAIDGKRWPVYSRLGIARYRRRSIAGHTVIYEISENPETPGEISIVVHFVYAPGRFQG
jgi:hypothetical protein